MPFCKLALSTYLMITLSIVAQEKNAFINLLLYKL